MSFTTFADEIEPDQLRGLAWSSMSARGSVENLGGTSNNGGGATRTWTAGSAMPCRVDPLGGGEGEVAERVVDRSTHLITVPPGTEIGTEDRFAIEDVGAFEITAVRTATREWLRFLEAVQVD